MFLSLWRGEGEGRDRGCSFSNIRILETILQQGQVSHSFSRAHFFCCFIFTQAPSYTQGAAQVQQQTNCLVLGKELHKTPTALSALLCTLAKYLYSFTLKVGLAIENLSITRKKEGESCCFN